MKNYSNQALELLGYTGVSISGDGIVKKDLSNIKANEPITHTLEEIDTLTTKLHKWDFVRKHRDELLKETDWTAGDDVPQTIKDKYRAYRQALRDITESFDSPDDVVYPSL